MKNWERKKLVDVCGFVRGPFGGSLKKNIFKADGYAVYEQQHAIYDQFEDIRYFIDENKFNEMKRFELKAGDLIMSCSGTMGKIAIVPEIIKKGIINQALLKLTPSPKKISTIFLKLWMQSESFQDSLKEYSGGAAIQNVASVAILKQIEIPLPPLPEQQRIVSILDEAFAAIAKAKANAEQNLKNAKELFESYLQGVFENKGEGWEEKTLGDVCSLITDGKHGDCENEASSGFYFLSAKDVKHGTLLFDNARQITKSGFEETHRRTNLKPGDICMVNTGATIGRISFAPDDLRTYNSTFQKSVAVIKTIPDLINNHYCCYLLQSDLKKLVKVSSGTAVPNLLLGDLKRHKINLPKTLKAQQTIVQKLDAVSTEAKKLETIYQQKIKDLEELKKSVLQKAFRGKLKISEQSRRDDKIIEDDKIIKKKINH